MLVHTLIKELGLFTSPDGDSRTRLQPQRPSPASATDLGLYHDREYLEYVLNPKHFGTEGDPIDSKKAAEYGIEEVSLLSTRAFVCRDV